MSFYNGNTTFSMKSFATPSAFDPRVIQHAVTSETDSANFYLAAGLTGALGATGPLGPNVGTNVGYELVFPTVVGVNGSTIIQTSDTSVTLARNHTYRVTLDLKASVFAGDYFFYFVVDGVIQALPTSDIGSSGESATLDTIIVADAADVVVSVSAQKSTAATFPLVVSVRPSLVVQQLS